MSAMLVKKDGYQRARELLDPRLAWVAEYLPLALPAGWSIAEDSPDGAAYRHRSGMTVILSGAREVDGLRWLHVSVARPDRLPSYQDQALVKALFIGREKDAYSVWPRESRHISIHNFCLHLWHCADGPVLPDFARGGKSI